jgi:hypothetical protein
MHTSADAIRHAMADERVCIDASIARASANATLSHEENFSLTKRRCSALSARSLLLHFETRQAHYRIRI